MPYIKSIVEAFNIPIIMVKNYEADDIIGTVAKQAEQKRLHCLYGDAG